MLRQVLYISAAVAGIEKEDIAAILGQAQTNNRRNHITGLLLYTGESFLQILEGEEADVGHTLERILADRRHNHMLILHDHRVSRRAFGDWSMGFRTIEPQWSLNGAVFPLTREALAKRVLQGDDDTLHTLMQAFCDIELGTAA